MLIVPLNPSNSTYKVKLLDTDIECESSESETGNVSTKAFHMQITDKGTVAEQRL
jgi:hypothetical protein